jgi:hypothetical protein
MAVVSAAAVLTAGAARAVERMEGAGAVDVRIADDVRNGEGRFSGIDYAKSDRFRRAWLVLHYGYKAPCQGSEGECEVDAPLQVAVPGLTYDPATKQVVYQRDGMDPVTCATVRSGGILSPRESLAATGRCTYRLVKVDRLVDDGFDGRRDRREEVHFAVRPP